MAPVHPLANLTFDEACVVRDVIKSAHPDEVIEYREIGLREPPKKVLLEYLEAERQGQLGESTKRPARLAYAHYDTIGTKKVPTYREALVDVVDAKIVDNVTVSTEYQPNLTM
jgi:primary-amine oxidase